MIRRALVFGDLHAEDQRLSIALDTLGSRADAVLSVGDLVDGPGSVDRTVALLRDADARVVRGNHERWFLQDRLRDLPYATRAGELSEDTRRWLEALPATLALETVAGRVLLCHGLGDDDMSHVGPEDYGYALESNLAFQRLLGEGWPVVINGHTHHRMVKRFGTLKVINAGTLFREHEPCVLLLDFAERVATFFDFLEERLVEAEPIVIPR